VIPFLFADLFALPEHVHVPFTCLGLLALRFPILVLCLMPHLLHDLRLRLSLGTWAHATLAGKDSAWKCQSYYNETGENTFLNVRLHASRLLSGWMLSSSQAVCQQDDEDNTLQYKEN